MTPVIEQNLKPTKLPRTSTTSRSTTPGLRYLLEQLSIKTRPSSSSSPVKTRASVREQSVHDQQLSLHPAYTSLPVNYDKTQGGWHCDKSSHCFMHLWEISGKQIIADMMEKLDRYRFKPVTAVPVTRRPTTEAVIMREHEATEVTEATRRLDKHTFIPRWGSRNQASYIIIDHESVSIVKWIKKKWFWVRSRKISLSLFKIPIFLPHFKSATMMHTVMFRVPMLSSERLDVVEELGQVRFKQFCTPVQNSAILYTCTARAAGVQISWWFCRPVLFYTVYQENQFCTVLYCTLVLQTLWVYKY